MEEQNTFQINWDDNVATALTDEEIYRLVNSKST